MENVGAADDAIQKASKAGKKLIPWRDLQKGPVLKLSLVKMVVTGIHLLKGTIGIDDKWRLLMGDPFAPTRVELFGFVHDGTIGAKNIQGTVQHYCR